MSVWSPSPTASTSSLRRIAGAVERVGVDRRVRLAVPGHSPAEPLIEVGDGAGAGFGNTAADDQPVGVEAVHVHVARGPALQVGGDNPGDRPALLDGRCRRGR